MQIDADIAAFISAPKQCFSAQVYELISAKLPDEMSRSGFNEWTSRNQSGGLLFLSALMGTKRSTLTALCEKRPAVSAAWITVFEQYTGHVFDNGAPPSATLMQLSSRECDEEAKTNVRAGRGGPRPPLLTSPGRGSKPLGAWLESEDRLHEVSSKFSDLRLYADVIEANAIQFFDGKGIPPGNKGDELLTDIICKVCF